jgi:hypothetical protein
MTVSMRVTAPTLGRVAATTAWTLCRSARGSLAGSKSSSISVVPWLVKERVSSTGSTLSAASSGRVTVARISSGGRLPAHRKISIRENETCGKMLRGAV